VAMQWAMCTHSPLIFSEVFMPLKTHR